jgi:hypothetical protein
MNRDNIFTVPCHKDEHGTLKWGKAVILQDFVEAGVNQMRGLSPGL